MVLSNDPGKKGSNFFCLGTIHFPHIGMFSFSHIKELTYKRAVYEIKYIFLPFVESFQPSIRLANNSQEKFTIPHIGCSSHGISVLCRHRRVVVIRKLVRKQGILIN